MQPELQGPLKMTLSVMSRTTQMVKEAAKPRAYPAVWQ
jgi:hypothetical protein